METSKNRGVRSPLRFFFLTLFCLGYLGYGQTVKGQLQFGASLHDATLDKYDGLKLIGRIHINRTYVDHEKWGFFKVGFAPIAVVDGVNVQIRSAGSLADTLDVVNSPNFSPGKLKHVEFRNFDISMLGEKVPRLRAESVRLLQANLLEFSHLSVTDSSGGSTSISRATLQISGPDCGCLRWNDAGRQQQLFVFQPLKN